MGEHRWYDAGFDWYFGDYSALDPKAYLGDVSRGGAHDERDLLYTDLDPVGGYDEEVVNVWNYFADVLRENGIFVQFRYPNKVQYLSLRKVN